MLGICSRCQPQGMRCGSRKEGWGEAEGGGEDGRWRGRFYSQASEPGHPTANPRPAHG